jgi:hypothetical protein
VQTVTGGTRDNFHIQNRGKESNYGRIISANSRQRRKLFVISDSQIIKPPITIVGHVGCDRSVMSVQYVINHHNYHLQFQWSLC